MGKTAKVCRGSWCMAFGFEKMATFDQVAKVLSAFDYDGIEVGGFFDHVTVERFPDKASRTKLKQWLNDDLDLEIAGIAPGPYGDLFRLPWATGSQEVYDEYLKYFESYIELAADMEIPGMRVDPGARGPIPYDADYDEIWDRVVRTFQHHADKGKEVGCTMLWELESLQPFNHPTETVKMLNDVGHSHFKLMYDTGHFQACSVIGHNQVQPRRGVREPDRVHQHAARRLHRPHPPVRHDHGDELRHVRQEGATSARASSTSTSSCPCSPRPTTASGGRSTRSRWGRWPGRTPTPASRG